MRPVFIDGEAVNLEAAALDALEWLRWMQKLLTDTGAVRQVERWQEDWHRLAGAIRSLDRLLLDKEPVFEERTFPGAVAWIIYPPRPYEPPDLISEFMVKSGIN